MTTVTVSGVVKDETGRKDSRGWKAFSPVYREGSDGAVVTMRKQQVRVVAGVFTAKLDPGVCVLENPDGQRYTVTVPNTDADLWDIIAIAVAFPPDTTAEALAAAVANYLEGNPPAADWNALDNKPTVIGAGATAAAARAAIEAADPLSVAAAQATATAAQTTALSAQTRRVQVTNNCFATGLQGAPVANPGTYRGTFDVCVAATQIQLVFGNFYTTATGAPKVDTDPNTSVTFKAGIEVNGKEYQVTFNGDAQKVLPGGGICATTGLPVDLNIGDVISVRVDIVAGTAYSNRFGFGAPYNTGGFTANTDLTPTGSAAVTPASVAMWMPMAIIGIPTDPANAKSAVVQGDSIGVGVGDGPFTGSFGGKLSDPWWSGGGIFLRALSGLAGIITTAQQGDACGDYVANDGHFRRAGFAEYCTTAIVEGGRNDLTAGASHTTLAANRLKIATANLQKGVRRNIITTITPVATSTDRFASVANQTPHASESARATHNAWVKDGCPIVNGVAVATGTISALRAGQPGHPIVGYIDVAAAVESTTPGKWKAAKRVLGDVAIAAGSGNMSSAAGDFTNADRGSDVIIPGAGAAGGNFVSNIVTVNSPTSVTLATPASTAVTGASCTVGPYTTDGTHPGGVAYAEAAGQVQAPLLALMA